MIRSKDITIGCGARAYLLLAARKPPASAAARAACGLAFISPPMPFPVPSSSREAREQAQTRGDKIGTSLDDARIHTKIASKLITDSETPARKINIDVQNGVVTPRGTVDAASEKVDAGRIAIDTDGVKRINNLLRVG